MFAFDEATAVERIAENCWQGNVSKGWYFRVAPNGGYMLAMAVRAMGLALKHADPVSVTANYISPAKAGPVEIKIETLRQGRRFSQATAIVRQNDQACLQVTGNFADFEHLGDEGCVELDMPVMGDLEASVALPNEKDFPFRDRVETRLVAEDYAFFPNGGKGSMEHKAWMRFSDKRPPDLLSLLLFADSLPRAMCMRTGLVGWIPTLDLSVQCLSKPAPGYIASRFYSRVLAGGMIEEQGELWDSKGTLVAVCRQSAVPRIPEDRLALLV